MFLPEFFPDNFHTGWPKVRVGFRVRVGFHGVLCKMFCHFTGTTRRTHFFPCLYVFVHALHIIGDSLGASRPLLDWYAVVLTVTPRPNLLQNARVSVFCVCACFRSQWCFRVVNESGQVLLLLSLIAIGREIGQEVQVSQSFL